MVVQAMFVAFTTIGIDVRVETGRLAELQRRLNSDVNAIEPSCLAEEFGASVACDVPIEGELARVRRLAFENPDWVGFCGLHGTETARDFVPGARTIERCRAISRELESLESIRVRITAGRVQVVGAVYRKDDETRLQQVLDGDIVDATSAATAWHDPGPGSLERIALSAGGTITVPVSFDPGRGASTNPEVASGAPGSEHRTMVFSGNAPGRALYTLFADGEPSRKVEYEIEVVSEELLRLRAEIDEKLANFVHVRVGISSGQVVIDGYVELEPELRRVEALTRESDGSPVPNVLNLVRQVPVLQDLPLGLGDRDR